MRVWIPVLAGAALLTGACGSKGMGGMDMGSTSATPSGPVATGTAATLAPDAKTVNVTLTEYGIQLDTDKLPAGPVRFVVRNTGQRGHELQVYPKEATSGGGHDMAMAAGRVISTAIGRLQLVPVGQTAAVDVTLTSGVWELGCHLQDSENGKSFDHYDRGMKTTLTVGT